MSTVAKHNSTSGKRKPSTALNRVNIKDTPNSAVKDTRNCPRASRKKEILYCIWLCKCMATNFRYNLMLSP